MLHRLAGAVILLALMFTSEVWALGLGDIRLDSALNAPLRAEIELVSATPEELQTLRVQLASAETFARYGLDRPLFLSSVKFDIKSGVNGPVIRVTSAEAIREPFVTFLVEATSPQGRVLREYTLLLDPPTFAPPAAVESAPQVTAPQRATEADRGVIERRESRPTQPQPVSRSTTSAAGSSQDFDSSTGDDYRVARSETLWGIASRVKPDNRLTINQTMLAIYEANPQAFDGNINRLRAGARLRIPSADQIYRIGRQDAIAEVRRQMSEWGGSSAAPSSRPSLSLVPPDKTDTGASADAYRDYQSGMADAPDSELQDRVRELEQKLADSDAMLAIRDNELAALRAELASRQAGAAPVADETGFEDAAAGVDMDVEAGDKTGGVIAEEETPVAAEPAAEDKAKPAPAPVIKKPAEKGFFGSILDAITGFWGMLIGALVLVAAVLVWFARRASMKDDDSSGWTELDADDDDGDDDQDRHQDTARLKAVKPADDAIVVHEQKATDTWADTESDTLEVEAPEEPLGSPQSLEDTFSSETAINLDQADPVAEADFHMAYGLYDQAADLVNSALAVQPERKDLMAKLCEIYFVWGNKDAFVTAAKRFRAALGGEASKDWDKTVIMGQQLAADNDLFAAGSAASAGLAAEGIDLSFEDDDGSEVALDLDFAAEDGSGDTEIMDIGGQDFAAADGVDFVFDGMDDDDESDDFVTAETPAPSIDDIDATTESPTVEQPPIGDEPTSEMPAMRGAEDKSSGQSADMTAEIDLDDLGLDLDGLADLDDDLSSDTGATGFNEALSDTDFNLDDMDLGGAEDTKADFVDLDFSAEDLVANEDEGSVGESTITDGSAATGINEALDVESIGEPDDESELDNDFDIDDALAATSETPALVIEDIGEDSEDEESDFDIDFDASLLDATGQTQVLNEDLMAKRENAPITDDDATLLASALDTEQFANLADDDDVDVTVQTPVVGDESTVFASELDDFDFAETEALPKGILDDDKSIGDDIGTDVDLDLGDLTAALQYSGIDDSAGDEGTIEHAVVEDVGGTDLSDQTLDFDIGNTFGDNDSPTVALSPEDRNPVLDEARTMTEVGTKLDLARAYVDMGDPEGARSILEEVLDEGDEGQQQQARKLLESLPS